MTRNDLINLYWFWSKTQHRNKKGEVSSRSILLFETYLKTVVLTMKYNGQSKAEFNKNYKRISDIIEKSDDPNRARYDKLVDNIKLREEQLKKMSKTDKERTALENELDNYKRAAERMKTKHKFENIKSFIGFFKY